MTTATRWHEGGKPHPIYSRYRRPGESELAEAFYPILWRTDGYRTPATATPLATSVNGTFRPLHVT